METAEHPEGSDNQLPVLVESKGGMVLPLPLPARIDLSSYRDIRLEMARVYRLYDQRKMNETDAKARHYMLSTLAQLIKASETDARLEAIERAMGMRKADEKQKPGGGLRPFRVNAYGRKC